MFKRLLDGWPLAQQILHRRDGTGPEARSLRTRALAPKHRGAGVDGRLVSIEGDPESPLSRGRLCPKGADSFELLTHAGRQTRVRYRKPYSTRWESLDLETAMDMIADRVWDTRERTFVEERDGRALMHTTGMAHLGGATLDNEENYLIKKLFAAGLGMVCISNQARI
jgi:formate dehydrogenase major subunit